MLNAKAFPNSGTHFKIIVGACQGKTGRSSPNFNETALAMNWQKQGND